MAVIRSYTALAFSALRRLRAARAEESLPYWVWEDLRQVCHLSALLAEREGLEAKPAYNLAQREIYHCLRELGFARSRRWKGFQRYETPISNL